MIYLFDAPIKALWPLLPVPYCPKSKTWSSGKYGCLALSVFVTFLCHLQHLAFAYVTPRPSFNSLINLLLDWKSKWNSSMLKCLLNPYLSKIVSSNNAIKKRHQEFSILCIWVTVLLKQFSLSIWCPLSCKSTPTL